MPPHCDTLDGPVVTAARQALDHDDVDLALPYVPADGEEEVRAAFDLARTARHEGPAARKVADLYFFDTVVRVHRRGEGEPHTGLRRAGLNVGSVLPVAEQAVVSGDPAPLVRLLCFALGEQVEDRLRHVRQLLARADTGVPAARAATSARLGFLVWSHGLHQAITAQAQAHSHDH